jgi:hypothetical protein
MLVCGANIANYALIGLDAAVAYATEISLIDFKIRVNKVLLWRKKFFCFMPQ